MKICKDCNRKFQTCETHCKCGGLLEPVWSSSDAPCSLTSLIERWERISKAWMQVARDRNDDAPDVANRAQARAAIYQDCAEELKENEENPATGS